VTQLVEQSMALSHESRQLLRKSRSIIAVNRRCLNPYWGISGSSEDDDRGGALLLSVRSRLERGVLIPAPHQMWARKLPPSVDILIVDFPGPRRCPCESRGSRRARSSRS